MNPEFQRNLWLEASPRRIAWAGVVLALIFGAVAFVTSNEGGLGRGAAMAGALGATGMAVFVVCAMLWGGRAAGNAVLSEIADRTWEFQRLSALTPWTMTWGKLFGATSLAWMCGLVGIAALLLTGSRGLSDKVWTLVFLLSLAVLLQALSMAAALIGVRKARAEGRAARSGSVAGGLVMGFILLSAIAGSRSFGNGVGTLGLSQIFTARGLINWWTLQSPAEVFRGLVVLAFAAWALAGVWRLMRLELQMQNTPLVWPGFLIFLALFAGGFLFGSGLAPALLAGAMAVALCAYGAAFAEPADRVRLRTFASALKRGDLARAAPLTPTTVAPVVIALLFVLAAFATGGGRSFGHGEVSLGHALALIAFMVRDLGVIAFFRFGPRPQRGDFGAVVALGLLYLVGGLVGGSLGGPGGMQLFTPIGDTPLVGIVSGGLQAAVAWWLAARRIRAPEGQLSGVAPSGPASAPTS